MHLLSQNKSKNLIAEEAYLKGDFLKSQSLWEEILEHSRQEENIKLELTALNFLVKNGMHLSENETALYYAKQAGKIAKTNNLLPEYGTAMNILGTVYEFLDLKDSVIYAGQEVLNTPGLQHRYYSDAYSSMATVFLDKGDYEKENVYLNKAIEIDRIHNDSSSLPFNLLCLGKNKLTSNSYNDALKLYFEALSFLRVGKDEFKFPVIYVSISSLFRTLQNFEKSEEYGLKAKTLCEELNLPLTKTRALFQLGATAQKQGDFQKALDYYLQIDNIYSAKWSQVSDQLIFKIAIAECYLGLEEYEEAGMIINENRPILAALDDNSVRLDFAILDARYALDLKHVDVLAKIKKTEKLNIEQKNKHVENKVNQLFSQYYFNLNDFKTAMLYEKKADILKDSIYRSEQAFVVHNLEALHQTKEQKVEIELLATKNKLQNSQLKQQKIIIIGTVICLVLFGVLLSFIAFLYRKVNIQKSIVENSLEEKNVLLKEIHHRVKNNLQVISSLLSLQAKSIDDDSALEALKQGQDRVYSMALIHEFLYEGENLVGVETTNYFERLLDNLMYSYSIEEEVSLNLQIEQMKLDVDTMIPIALIVNELVSNAFKHAFKENEIPAALNISLSEVDRYLVLEVKDNGEAIKNTKEIQGKSFGFDLINSFSRKLQAIVELEVNNGLSVKLLIGKYNRAA